MHAHEIIMPMSVLVFVCCLSYIFFPALWESVHATITTTTIPTAIANITNSANTTSSTATVTNDIDVNKPVKYKDRPVGGKPRMITAEELASKDGSDGTGTIWLSIMSEVFDVSTGPQYYAPKAGYSIFAGRDANVPFITGNFTQAEAERSISTLTPFEMMNVENFLNDTYRFGDNAYTFVGYLIGELYDVHGNPTDILREVHKKIDGAKVERAKQEQRRQEVLAERRRKDEEKRLANGGVDPPRPKPIIIKKVNNQTEKTIPQDGTSTGQPKPKQQRQQSDNSNDVAKEL